MPKRIPLPIEELPEPDFSPEETVKRRDAAIRKALNTPPIVRDTYKGRSIKPKGE